MTLSIVFFSSSLGSRIDKSHNRARPLFLSIVANHSAMILSYLAWMVWPTESDDSSPAKMILFGAILACDVVQALSATGNTLSLTRDWIPALVGIDPTSNVTLTQVNAAIARVDLFCKVVSPSLLPVIVNSFPKNFWIAFMALFTAVVWAIEMYCLQNVTRENPMLLSPKPREERPSEDTDAVFNAGPATVYKAWALIFQQPFLRLRHFFSMPVWPASMTMAFLYLTVLLYSASMVTYLLHRGFSLNVVTLARTSGSLMGFVATFTTPVAARYVNRNLAPGSLKGIVPRRLGTLGIAGQFICLVSMINPI